MPCRRSSLYLAASALSQWGKLVWVRLEKSECGKCLLVADRVAVCTDRKLYRSGFGALSLMSIGTVWWGKARPASSSYVP